ncbi:hypothetical protein BDR03DRAFT_943030 [Suillus americanus]|nr:hypothetical protein BDR03DRAFT_943030 [Suillus americanus]
MSSHVSPALLSPAPALPIPSPHPCTIVCAFRSAPATLRPLLSTFIKIACSSLLLLTTFTCCCSFVVFMIWRLLS